MPLVEFPCVGNLAKVEFPCVDVSRGLDSSVSCSPFSGHQLPRELNAGSSSTCYWTNLS